MIDPAKSDPVGPVQTIAGNVIHVRSAKPDPQSVRDQALVQSASHAASIASLVMQLAIELELWADANQVTQELCEIIKSTRALAGTTEHVSSTIGSIPLGKARQV